MALFCVLILELFISTLQPHRIFTLEQEFGGHGEVTARSCTYEIIQGQVDIFIFFKFYLLIQNDNFGIFKY